MNTQEIPAVATGNLLSSVRGRPEERQDKREGRMMEIQMYNVGLGECFLLGQGDERIAVNCGTRNKEINAALSAGIFREIGGDIRRNGCTVFLTQFDPEHVGGFLQIVREESAGTQAVCLPDLFSERWMSDLLALLLLQDLSRSCFLPGKAVTLSGLMEVLLTISCPIRLLKRGDQVGDIQVLWPQKTRLRKDLEETLGEIGIPGAVYEQDRWMWKELVQVAARMREIFMRLVALSGMEEIPRNGEHIPVELEEEVRGFRADFRKLRRNERFLGMAERFQESVELLRTFHDRTGLIFHVGEDGKENFLYTGNGWKEWAVWLEKNEDGLVPLHRKYWCISVPGHGTDECYWDFAPYAPRHFLVSNGYVAGQEAGKISGRYAGMFAVPGVIMHCTSSNWCEGNKDGICSCWDAQITSPELCSVIREEETKSQKRKEDETA